eukprot:TRINITY_DN27320_c0_g1_i1.p1 TRINITY_DN27320_c0_g1~~TRINITY_DN27320_c0_g1_i1.p1  ORF type:complete len:191 (-),score=1.62 TRINITY_DN27320_c0_g1_i1:156-728(-)
MEKKNWLKAKTEKICGVVCMKPPSPWEPVDPVDVLPGTVLNMSRIGTKDERGVLEGTKTQQPVGFCMSVSHGVLFVERHSSKQIDLEPVALSLPSTYTTELFARPHDWLPLHVQRAEWVDHPHNRKRQQRKALKITSAQGDTYTFFGLAVNMEALHPSVVRPPEVKITRRGARKLKFYQQQLRPGEVVLQ